MTPKSVSSVQIPVVNSRPTNILFPPDFLPIAHFSKWNHYLCNYSGHIFHNCITPLSMDHPPTKNLIFFPFSFFYLEGEEHQCVVASQAPPTGRRGLQTRLGIEPATLWVAGWHSSTLARAKKFNLLPSSISL